MAATALRKDETKEFFDSPAELAAKLDTVSEEFRALPRKHRAHPATRAPARRQKPWQVCFF